MAVRPDLFPDGFGSILFCAELGEKFGRRSAGSRCHTKRRRRSLAGQMKLSVEQLELLDLIRIHTGTGVASKEP